MHVTDGSAVVIVDTSGNVHIWWPLGRVIETEPSTRDLTLDQAKQANRAISLTLACPAVKVVCASKQTFVVQHELKVRWSTIRFRSLSC